MPTSCRQGDSEPWIDDDFCIPSQSGYTTLIWGMKALRRRS
jgi:hypothetical protein